MKLGRRLHETESQWSSYDTGWMDGVHFKHFAQIYFAFPRQLIVVLRIDSLAQQRQYRRCEEYGASTFVRPRFFFCCSDDKDRDGERRFEKAHDDGSHDDGRPRLAD